MSKGCKCGGWFDRDISPWCEIHAIPENLTADEKREFIARLKKTIEKAQERIDALSQDQIQQA